MRRSYVGREGRVGRRGKMVLGHRLIDGSDRLGVDYKESRHEAKQTSENESRGPITAG